MGMGRAKVGTIKKSSSVIDENLHKKVEEPTLKSKNDLAQWTSTRLQVSKTVITILRSIRETDSGVVQVEE